MIRLQNRGLHYIYGRHVPPPENWNMRSVPAQLRYNDLLFFIKCLAGVTDYDAMARITLGRVHHGDDQLYPRLQQPPARTELGTNVFDFRVVKYWNEMPHTLKSCSTAQFPLQRVEGNCAAEQSFNAGDISFHSLTTRKSNTFLPRSVRAGGCCSRGCSGSSPRCTRPCVIRAIAS
ncbi:Hypothetical predicted protein [Cloeon dipterum]|uniref:Uncharacterized protein n=1 Tax=Cloeon dipterum TaxID=197152 RepID=A0A8S1BUS3_9INSE|nr:Hypothetical predicted protein [Cloeon dipterum]